MDKHFKLTTMAGLVGIVATFGIVANPLIAGAKSPGGGMYAERAMSLAIALYSVDAEAAMGGCREGSDDERFESVDVGCRDNATGLIWSKLTDDYTGLYGPIWKYDQLTDSLKTNTFGGYRWRIPTRDELTTVLANDSDCYDGYKYNSSGTEFYFLFTPHLPLDLVAGGGYTPTTYYLNSIWTGTKTGNKMWAVMPCSLEAVASHKAEYRTGLAVRR